MISDQESLERSLWRHLKGDYMSEENKNVTDALNEIFDDDPAKKARDKEIAKYEKKRQKAIEREQKKLAKKKKSDVESVESSDASGDKGDGTDEKKSDTAWSWDRAVAENGGKPVAVDVKKEINDKAEDGDSASSDSKQSGSDSSDSGIKADADSSTDEELDEKAIKKKLKEEKKQAKKAAKAEKEINIVKDLISLCIYILIVIGICWTVLTYVGQRTEVSGESMSNTLHSGDTLWIDKLEYEFGSPKRFDVVVFPYGDDDETFYIKRFIGLPGETVYIDEDGVIYINGEELQGDIYGRETIAEDKRGVASEEITLGEDEYFVLGDNRNNSRDSRVADVGNIHKKDIIGRAVFRFTGGFGKIE